VIVADRGDQEWRLMDMKAVVLLIVVDDRPFLRVAQL